MGDRERCEALVQEAWARLTQDSQCSRLTTKEPGFADVALCYQHMEKAERDEELELTGGRTLILARESFDEETQIENLVFRVVSNVSHFHRAQSAPVNRKELATQLVIRQFGSPMPQLADQVAKQDALMEVAAQDMMAAQRILVEWMSRAMGMNVTEFPDRSKQDTTPEK